MTEEIETTSLVAALHEAASKLSYYNAGEGDMRRREETERDAAHHSYYTLLKVAQDRGVYDPEAFKSYLV